ncbi:MAG: hypothetical protein CME62_05170 [Halobacteriovoraceae bacterium]|nr:hypothetical protein [Halobacteriovoraceae bacterium]|tara:strand:+ start:9540 stop:10220 length:681 start_codon:yes stop_codon:yes gene_type:complete
MPKAVQIKSMFNNISGSYDLLNDMLSLGIHRLWKKKLVRHMTKGHPQRVLDCATGTGDIALSIKKQLPSAEVYGVDFSANMLKVAEDKSKAIHWSVQDVMQMPFEDKDFDHTCISYGIRNVEDYRLALKEMARVTKSKICILEFGQPQNFFLRGIYFGIMNYFIPFIGKLFNKEEAYKYLIDSSKSFPCAYEFTQIIKESTGFDKAYYIPLFGGVTYLYIAENYEN